MIPGYIPTPLGEIFEFTPTFPEVMITIGCWAVGALTFTLLARAAVAIESGRVRADKEVESTYLQPD